MWRCWHGFLFGWKRRDCLGASVVYTKLLLTKHWKLPHDLYTSHTDQGVASTNASSAAVRGETVEEDDEEEEEEDEERAEDED